MDEFLELGTEYRYCRNVICRERLRVRSHESLEGFVKRAKDYDGKDYKREGFNKHRP